MVLDYEQSVALADVPVLSAEELRREVLEEVRDGGRLLALFGLPDADGTGLCAIIAHGGDRFLRVMRTASLTHYTALTPDCPQAHLFERELWEQWNIRPEGHPWLKPVRFVPHGCLTATPGERPGPAQLTHYRVEGEEVHEVAVGPVHAGVIEPGHFRFQCYGENVLHLEISLGFQHRDVERRLLGGPHPAHARLMECVAGDTSIGHATAHATLLERLAGVTVPERANRLRRLGLELERLANHTGDLGAIAGDTGFLPTSAWNGRIRGDFLNLTAEVCGNRFGRNWVCPGGVMVDVNAELCARLFDRLRHCWRDVREAVKVMFASASVLDRLEETGEIAAATARELGLVGVAARACGLARDARFDAPLSCLPLCETQIRVEKGGDVLSRARVRSRELADSVDLACTDIQALSHSEGAICQPLPDRLPAGRLAVAQVEGWRGEICHVGITDAQGRLACCKIYDPSFHNWAGLEAALRGQQISDFPLCNKSFNLSYCGHDL